MYLKHFISIFFILISLNAKDINFGIMPQSLFTTEKEVSLSMKIWTGEIKKNANLIIIPKIYKDENILYKDFIEGKIQIASFPPSLYFKNKKELLKQTQKLYTFSLDTDKNKFIEYYFIKNKTNGTSLDNKEEKYIYFKESELSARMWLDYTFLKEKKKSYKDYFIKEHSLKRQSSIIYKVFFKKNNFAVVPKVIYETITEINPQIKKKIKIIKKSKAIFISLIGLINKNLDKKDLDKIISLSIEKKYENIRAEAFSISSITSLILLEKEDLQEYEDFNNEYKILKRKVHLNVNTAKK